MIANIRCRRASGLVLGSSAEQHDFSSASRVAKFDARELFFEADPKL
jgi:hypothetical protein